MDEEHFIDPDPSTKPERETMEGRLDLRHHHHLARSRYRLLNLRDCAGPKAADDPDLEPGE